MNKKLVGISCLVGLLAMGSVPVMANAPVVNKTAVVETEPGYKLRAGDELQITVFNHPELSTPANSSVSQFLVRPDGQLSFPLLGTVQVAGMTVEQLQSKLTADYAKYLRNPNVTINIKKLGTTRVYVLGEIKQSGLYELTKSHRVVDAVAAAGGFTDKSAKKKLLLIRRGSNTPEMLNINDYLTKGDQSQNPELQEGDTLYFSSNGKVDIVRDVLPYISSAYYITRFNKD